MSEFQKTCPIHTSQPPYNLFERGIEKEILPYTEKNGIVTLAYGALCRGMLSGRMRADTKFDSGDLRNVDPKFQAPRFEQYVAAVGALNNYAQDKFGKSVLELSVRWLLEQGNVVALWGGRRPEQMDPIPEIMTFKLEKNHLADIDKIIAEYVQNPIGPEFMGSPDRTSENYAGEYPLG